MIVPGCHTIMVAYFFLSHDFHFSTREMFQVPVVQSFVNESTVFISTKPVNFASCENAVEFCTAQYEAMVIRLPQMTVPNEYKEGRTETEVVINCKSSMAVFPPAASDPYGTVG